MFYSLDCEEPLKAFNQRGNMQCYVIERSFSSSVKSGLVLRNSFRSTDTNKETFFNNPDEK